MTLKRNSPPNKGFSLHQNLSFQIGQRHMCAPVTVVTYPWAGLFKAGLRWHRVSVKSGLRSEGFKRYVKYSYICLQIWRLDAFQRREKFIRERLLNKRLKKPGLNFNPLLGLISLRKSGPWTLLPHSIRT